MTHRNSDYWERGFTESEAFLRHSGDTADPYFRLSSKLISDGYFNGGKVAENNPKLYGEACEALWACTNFTPSDATRVIGPAVGGIAMAQRIAEASGLKSAHTTIVDDEHVFKRQRFGVEEKLIMVDDTLTTGSTFSKLQKAALKVSPFATFTPFVLVLCDRSDPEVYFGYRTICLIRPVFRTWVDGRNPFTEDGQERVPPISEVKMNWEKLAAA